MVDAENSQNLSSVNKGEESDSLLGRTDRLREIACSIEEYSYEDERLLQEDKNVTV